MKYVLLLTRGEWQESGSDEERARVFGEIQPWWERLYASGKMVDGRQLQPPATATTVVFENGKSLLIDRPLMEAKEAVGGFGVLDVADLDEALSIVRTLPIPDGKIEVRPIVER